MGKLHETADVQRMTAEFPARLRAAMSSAGLGTTDLAAAIGITAGSVSAWFNGKPPSLHNLVRAASELGVTVSFLLADNAADGRSLEALSLRLGSRIGRRRLIALTYASDSDLLDALDQAIGRTLSRRDALPTQPAPEKP